MSQQEYKNKYSGARGIRRLRKYRASITATRSQPESNMPKVKAKPCSTRKTATATRVRIIVSLGALSVGSVSPHSGS